MTWFLPVTALFWFECAPVHIKCKKNLTADRLSIGKLPWDRCHMVKSYPINLVLGKQPVLQRSTDRRPLWIYHHHKYLCCFQILFLNKERLRLFIDKRFHSEILGMLIGNQCNLAKFRKYFFFVWSSFWRENDCFIWFLAFRCIQSEFRIICRSSGKFIFPRIKKKRFLCCRWLWHS